VQGIRLGYREEGQCFPKVGIVFDDPWYKAHVVL
jgi:hypothetical protein